MSLALCFAPPQAQAEDILSILERRAQTEHLRPPAEIPYIYTASIDLTEVEGDEVTEIEAVLQIDPSQAPGARVTILSATDPENESLIDFLKDIEDPKNDMAVQADDFWCESADNADEFDPSDFEVVSETETEAIIKPKAGKLAELLMQSEENDNMGKQERKMMKKLMTRIDGQMIVSKPDARLQGFKVWMTRPMKMMLVAKLKSMEIEQDCAVAPNGHMYTQGLKLSVRAKALGQSHGQDMNVQITDLRPLPR